MAKNYYRDQSGFSLVLTAASFSRDARYANGRRKTKRAFVARRISSRVETFWQQHRWFQRQSAPERALAAPSFDSLGWEWLSNLYYHRENRSSTPRALIANYSLFSDALADFSFRLFQRLRGRRNYRVKTISPGQFNQNIRIYYI